MFKLFVASCLAASASCQVLDAKNAKILKEQRFDAGDGRFGAAFAQEDGTVFREETSSDGERIGQYSYIDQDGQTITVRYSAGKDGFRILEGAHIPEGATGLQSAPFDPSIAEAGSQEQPPAPRQQETRLVPQQQQFRPAPVQQQQQFRPAPVQQQPAADFNPFINPADPTHRDFQHNTNAAQFRPQPQQAQPQQFPQARQQVREQARAQAQTIPNPASVPACANCEGINPFINPADSSHTQLFASQPAAPAFRQPQQSFRQPASTFVPQQQQQAVNPSFTFQQRTQTQQQPLQPAFASQQSEQARPVFRAPQQAPPAFRQPPSPAPASLNNFQGNLNLNRFDNGFNFEFSS